MKIEFMCREDRDQFRAMLDDAHGPDHISDQHGALQDAELQAEAMLGSTDDVARLAYYKALVQRKEEHIKRMQTFLHVLGVVCNLGVKGKDDRFTLSGGVELGTDDLSRTWNGVMTVGMIHRPSPDKDRPWASTWEGHS